MEFKSRLTAKYRGVLMSRFFSFFSAAVSVLLLLPLMTHAQQETKVLILPFAVNSVQNLSYLESEIPDFIAGHLKKQGVTIVSPDETGITPHKADRVENIKKAGLRANADQVIWGSITVIGKGFSLDINMVNPFESQPPFILYGDGEGMENLFGVVKETSEGLYKKLFKKESVVGIEVTGNDRIESEAIKRVIKTKPGDIYKGSALSKDLKSIYGMGYFEDIRIEASDAPEGKTIVFKIKEKPTIRRISIYGNRVYDNEKIRENLDISTGSIVNIFRVRSNIEHIESLYREKNYHNVKVDYKLHPRENNQADLEFRIEEGAKIRIKEIIFKGNVAYKNKKLKKLIKTSEKGFFYWLTSSGELNRENLKQDAVKLAAFYHNNGFINAKVADPDVVFKDDWIYITIKIQEGNRYKVGKVDITGDLILDKEKLFPGLTINKEMYYNREIVRKDVIFLSDVYSNKGYANVDVLPATSEKKENLVVDINYKIEKGAQVYFDNIIITGNTKTRDKVIRRELKVYEQELYSGTGLKRSIRNLRRLDYFEDVNVDSIRGKSDDKLNLKINVTEKPTGTFTFGAGYSSVENLFLTGSVAQRNLFGKGQVLRFKAQIGGTTDQYSLSFTEPWLFDIPLSFSTSLYRVKKDYDTYDRTSQGGGIAFSYPVFDYTRLKIGYGYDISDIEEITDDASDNIKDLVGKNTTSSVSASLIYDSRDRIFNPTEGSEHSITAIYAGLGGDVGFSKFVAETGWYIPTFWEVVMFVHGKTGYVEKVSGLKLPDYERFYLGGMNSIRGYDWQDIHVKSTNSDGAETEIGGDKFIQFNLEFIFPLLKDVGLMGVVFYDTGDVFGTSENIAFDDLYQTYGGGIRWYSPMGPMRLEYGQILDPKEGGPSGGKWEFTMGAAF